jgi:pimeloyl-ACP methyl ester carboxylesterase
VVAQLHVEDPQPAAAGLPIVLLHGLTATHRYVVMGSKHLERAGHRVVAYDARGHGRSAPAPDGYGYEHLAEDLLGLLDALDLDRSVLVGASMGAHTLLRAALAEPARVAGLVVVTPAYDPATADEGVDGWDRLARGLREGGVEGFVAAYDRTRLAPEFAETVVKVLRQRLALHEHPHAVADAIEQVPRSRPFGALEELEALRGIPSVVVASRDESDPGHPLAVGERYAALLGAELVVEEPGRSPVAWQGGQLSRVVERLAQAAA